MENVLFKISFPAEFHAQTAVECAMQLHPQVKDRLDEIQRIVIRTHESAIRIIDKKGPLNNPADRDHCIQYMVAVPLVHGRLTAADYEDDVASDPRIDALREKMECVEDKQFSADYHDPDKRSIANGITIHFKDGTKTERSGGRVSDRPSPPPRRGHSGAGSEVPHQPRCGASRPGRLRRSWRLPRTSSGSRTRRCTSSWTCS